MPTIGNLITGIHYSSNEIPQSVFKQIILILLILKPQFSSQFEQGNVTENFDIQGREYATGINNIQLNPGTFGSF
jgi:hypothetical protein